jgi:hypothetical protein
MSSFLDKTGTMALRLSDDDRRMFREQYETTIAKQHGRQMREFVVVPDELLEDTQELHSWFDLSHCWIGILKPKPTKRS